MPIMSGYTLNIIGLDKNMNFVVQTYDAEYDGSFIKDLIINLSDDIFICSITLLADTAVIQNIKDITNDYRNIFEWCYLLAFPTFGLVPIPEHMYRKQGQLLQIKAFQL